MAAYVINDVHITDPKLFEQYRQLSPASVEHFGGRFLARGGQTAAIEGDWIPRRLVIIEFPSLARAQAWVESAEYAPARRLRQLSARSRMVMVEGVPEAVASALPA